MRDTDVAIVGVACRFPDAATPEQFWGNLDDGLVSTRELPRVVFRAAGVPDEVLTAPDFVPVAATLADPGEFAAEFFGYPPREAELIDPAQRLFLEACWEALESAGHPPREGGPVTGVFAGTGPGNYALALQVARARTEGVAAVNDDADLYLGSAPDFLTSRVAYKLGLRGPSVSVQTACSSSLAAVHQGVLALLSGECDVALAGGATVNEPLTGYRYRPGGLTSQDGLCRAFDARSTGTSFSSGVGVVVLRRLADALTSGDPVLAVVRGTAIGNDGADRSGFTAPSPAGVASVVRTALRLAGASSNDVRYAEAHGSGTPLGDQIELRALIEGLGPADRGRCALGTVKANIGHCGPSAGIAGLIKAVHVARTGSLPPHPLFEIPRDPGVLAESPFFVPARARSCTDPERLVLVNSMGLGGTSAAAVLAPPPAPTRPHAGAAPVVRLVVSARTRGELDAMSRSLADELDRAAHPVADVAYTLRVGRRDFPERRVVTAGPDRLAAALRLPRPPLVRTLRSEIPRGMVLVLGPGGEQPDGLAALASALGAEVAAGPLDAADPRFPILVGHGEPGPDRHVLPVDGGRLGAEQVDDAAAAAWLRGAVVDWEALAGGRGRRVALPTYPFRRRRYWALDRLDPVGAPPAAPPTRPPAGPSPAGPVPAGAASAGQSDGQLSTADGVERDLVALWRELFGVATIGLDDEFGALGGTSLLSVRMVLEIQRRHDVLINLHRAGGSKATVRHLAALVRRLQVTSTTSTTNGQGEVADGDGALVDADLALPLGDLVPVRPAPAAGVLLTGASGFLGSFLLHELLRLPGRQVFCLVRADGEADGRRRLDAAAARFDLPRPDPDRVTVVPGDLRGARALCERHELAGRVGLVLHCAARVVFTEPYRVLREDNLLPLVELVRWMRASGVADLGFVSTIAATGQALGGRYRTRETRDQPLDPRQGGYGVGKWVGERILERAERDGLRVRVFRPGWILGSTETGAANPKDLIWHVLASGLAVGAHPLDDRALPVAPVDLVARAIVELSAAPGAAGQAYHLVDETALSPRRLFGLLADAGAETRPVDLAGWQRLVAEQALRTGSEVLSNMALYELDGHQVGPHDLEAAAWRPWLGERGLTAAPTGKQLLRSLTRLAEREPAFGGLVPRPMEVR